MKLIIDEAVVRKLHNTLVTSKICKENECSFTRCPLNEFCMFLSIVFDSADRIKNNKILIDEIDVKRLYKVLLDSAFCQGNACKGDFGECQIREFCNLLGRTFLNARRTEL